MSVHLGPPVHGRLCQAVSPYVGVGRVLAVEGLDQLGGGGLEPGQGGGIKGRGACSRACAQARARAMFLCFFYNSVRYSVVRCS